MIFHGQRIITNKATYLKYVTPKLKVGDIIMLQYHDEEVPIPGTRRMKAGRYVVRYLREALCSPFPNAMVYGLYADRTNSTYAFPIYTDAIDLCIDAGFITLK